MSPHSSRRQAPLVNQEAARIYRLIAKRDYKSAIYEAKALYKRQPGPSSEDLLVGAYTARIRDLLEKGLVAEGKSLMQMVQNQYPSARRRMGELTSLLAVRSGNLDDLLRPLNDPGLAAEPREAIEEAVKREVTDLKSLAECGALVPDHPLRRGAQAILNGLAQVTRGPVAEDPPGLEQISHRSPLAPWKLLVRAIGAFYRREDDRCEKMLEHDRAGVRPCPTGSRTPGDDPGEAGSPDPGGRGTGPAGPGHRRFPDGNARPAGASPDPEGKGQG